MAEDMIIREMYFVQDLLFESELEAHNFDEGKPHLVRKVYVTCAEEDKNKPELDLDLVGWIFSDYKNLVEELELEREF
jgi:hypothetical protein